MNSRDGSDASDPAREPSLEGPEADARRRLREEFIRRLGYLAPSQEALLGKRPVNPY